MFIARAASFCIVSLVFTVGANASDAPPPWAYPVAPPPSSTAQEPTKLDTSLKRVPGSDVALTLEQIGNPFDVPDWHPNEHPQMPQVVKYGRRPAVFACGYCHLPNGLGRSENSSVAGLPEDYIIQQIEDYRNGLRKSSEPRMRPPSLMLAISNAVTDDELKEAAAYFSSMKLEPWIRVVETDMVPRTKVAGAMMVAVEGEDREPIGTRIIELPEDLARTELRDSQSGFVAYVPPGSIAAGQKLARTGGGDKTLPCANCHGEDLRGLGPVPGLAGRSPTYMVRQLFDFKNGARAGTWSPLMQKVVAQLTLEDMVALSAYTASLDP